MPPFYAQMFVLQDASAMMAMSETQKTCVFFQQHAQITVAKTTKFGTNVDLLIHAKRLVRILTWLMSFVQTCVWQNVFAKKDTSEMPTINASHVTHAQLVSNFWIPKGNEAHFLAWLQFNVVKMRFTQLVVLDVETYLASNLIRRTWFAQQYAELDVSALKVTSEMLMENASLQISAPKVRHLEILLLSRNLTSFSSRVWQKSTLWWVRRQRMSEHLWESHFGNVVQANVRSRLHLRWRIH
jgi:hypothetical protein